MRLGLPSHLSKLDTLIFLAFEKGLGKDSLSLLLVLEALWPAYAQQQGQLGNLCWQWIGVFLVGITMQLPWQAISSYCNGQSASCLLVNQDEYEMLLACYAQTGSSFKTTNSTVIDVLNHVYQELSLQDKLEDAKTVASVLQEVQGLCRYCIGHGFGILQNWMIIQQYFDSNVKLLCNLPILTALQAVLTGDYSAVSSFLLSPVIQRIQKLGTGNPLTRLTALSLWISSLLDLNAACQSSGIYPNSMTLFVKAFAASVSACISDPKQREDESFWSACLRSLPATLCHLIMLSFDATQEDADGTWPVALLKLLGRNDLVGTFGILFLALFTAYWINTCTLYYYSKPAVQCRKLSRESVC
ncbi:hypothetical protein EON65_09705 [archaeon]|nr:MAG: hypothetical protein EON65_09705 [archaeon]